MLTPYICAQATTKEGLDAVKAQLKGYSKGMEVSMLLHSPDRDISSLLTRVAAGLAAGSAVMQQPCQLRLSLRHSEGACGKCGSRVGRAPG